MKPALGTAWGEEEAQGCAHLSTLCVHGGCQGSARWHRAGLLWLGLGHHWCVVQQCCAVMRGRTATELGSRR